MMTFTELFNQGFSNLCSVIPPEGELVEGSKIDRKHLGKAPGVRQGNGRWRGDQNFLKRKTTLDHCAQWDKSGANVGLQAKRFPSIDIDVLDAALSEFVAEEAQQFLGEAPVRVGKAPKQLLMYRLEGDPFGKKLLTFTAPDGVGHKIEVLGDGQQYVVAGTHPEGHSYTVEPSLDKYSAETLTPVSSEQMGAFFDHIAPALEAKGCTIGSRASSSSSSGTVDQDSLKGKIALVREAVAVIPNNFDRGGYLQFCYAVRAACADDVEAGRSIWVEWASRWEGGKPDPHYDGATYDGLKPPFRIGADYLYRLARQVGWIGDAQAEFGIYTVDGEPPAPPPARPPRFSDQDLVVQVIRAHGDGLRFLPHSGKFLLWDGSRWEVDSMNGADAKIISVLTEQSQLAGRSIPKPSKAERTALRVASANCYTNVKKLIKSELEILLSPEQCDADQWLLGVPGGTVDLRTGKAITPDPKDHITKQTAVAPAHGDPLRWNSFLNEAAGGDFDLINFLQRLCGYLLTGSIREHCITFFHGSGGNGKSVFLNAVSEVLGDYAGIAPMDAFMKSYGTRHPTDLAGLAGSRVVLAQETGEGRGWDEERIKAISAGDTISARFMNKDFFSYQPRFKLIFSGNHKPEIRNLDAAMKRRINLVPFTCVPKVVDQQLPEKLKAEYPQILMWMIEGCRQWQEVGLNPPEKVRVATQEYFTEEDRVGQWINENCRLDPLVETELVELYDDFDSWAQLNGFKPGDSRRLSNGLANRGFEGSRTKDIHRRKQFMGIRLLNETEKASNEFNRTDTGVFGG